MIPFIIRRLLWMVVLLLVISFLTFVIFYTLPSADPAALRAGRQPTPELLAVDPRDARARQAVVRPVPEVPRAPRLPLRLRPQLPEQRLGQGADLRPPAGDRRAGRRRRGRLAAGRHPDRDHLRHQARHVDGPRGRWAPRSSRSRRPVYWLGLVSLYLFSKDIGMFPLFEGQGAYPTSGNIFTDPGEVIPALILPWMRARRLVRRDLRALPARQPARDDVARTTSAPRAPRACASGASSSGTACARRSRRSSRSSASTSASCSAARSSPRPSSTSPASAAWPTTRSRRATCRPCRARCCIGAFFIIFLNLIVDIVYAFLDPRVRY